MPLQRVDIENALIGKLGFAQDERDHRVFILTIGRRIVSRTMVSRGTQYRSIGNPLIGAMARQLHIPRRLFEEIVRCTKGKSDYLKHLMDRGIITSDEASGREQP